MSEQTRERMTGEELATQALAGRRDFQNVYVTNTTGLSHADLSGANLRGANLSHADLRNADLRRADLDGVTLTLDQIGVALLTSDMVEQLIARLGYVKGEASALCPQWLHECLTPFVLDKIEELLRRSFDEDCTREQTAAHLNSLALAWRLTLDGDLAKAFDHIEDVTADLP